MNVKEWWWIHRVCVFEILTRAKKLSVAAANLTLCVILPIGTLPTYSISRQTNITHTQDTFRVYVPHQCEKVRDACGYIYSVTDFKSPLSVQYVYSNVSQWSLISLKLPSVLHYLYRLNYYCFGLMKVRPHANSYSSDEVRVHKLLIGQYKKGKISSSAIFKVEWNLGLKASWSENCTFPALIL